MDESFGYATMGERLLAFFFDAATEAALVAGFVGVLARSPSLKELEGVLTAIIPIVYMTLGEFVFHGSLGKRLMGIQVRTDLPELPYPSLFQLLLRESIGKFVSGAVLGLGFRADNAKKKTWHDRLAGTVVVRSRKPGRFRPLIVALLICAYFVLSIAWREISRSYRHSPVDPVHYQQGPH
ncbi:MAG TPA: RDD family protein [Candidatus Angelobacter sp.]|nr:RDD family protein [Candidatus Angelobacter sp.]